jgi:hypothetical protein
MQNDAQDAPSRMSIHEFGPAMGALPCLFELIVVQTQNRQFPEIHTDSACYA